jgi:hypothetical protein
MLDIDGQLAGAWRAVLDQREEILRAFVAKYGCQPDEIMQVEERSDNQVRWYVTHKTQPKRKSAMGLMLEASGLGDLASSHKD